MSVVYRYDPTCGSYCNGPRMECCKDGDWVAVEDYESASHQRDTLRAEVERLKESVATLDKLYVSRTDELRESEAEVERLKAERDEARKWLEGICSEFEGAVAHADWRAAGSKGMSVPFTGDFADMTRHPGVIGRMRWWVKVFRAALKGEKP